MRSGLGRAALLLAALLGPPAAHAADHVTFGIGWLPQADFGGFYQAKADGGYRRAGLDVDLVSGSPQNGAIMMLATGAYDFVRISNSGVALAMATAHLPYVVIAAIYQKEPTVIIVHDGPHAPTSLADLRGRPIMISPEATDNYWAFLKQRYGYVDSQIRRYTGSSAVFVADPNVSQQGYVTNDAPRMRAEGLAIRDFLLADNGYSAYGTLIVARRSLVEQQPALVDRFLQASIAGWCQYLHGDRHAGDALILAGNPDYTQRNADDAVAAIDRLGLVEGGDAAQGGVGGGIGSMSQARWLAYLGQMRDTGLYARDLDLSSVYTTRFLHHTRCTTP